MHGADQVTTESIDWRRSLSELFNEGIDAGKKLLNAKLAEEAAENRRMNLQLEAEGGVSKTRATGEVILYLAIAAFLGIMVWRNIKSGR